MNIKYNFLILNGPNLKYVGKREPDIYGTHTMKDFLDFGKKFLNEIWNSIHIEFYQTNSEGIMIDKIEKAKEEGIAGIVLNAGAYTHTSLALADCIAWINIPTVEVHLSNIFKREEIRHKSLIAPHCIGTISGFGIMSYVLGVFALWNYLESNL